MCISNRYTFKMIMVVPQGHLPTTWLRVRSVSKAGQVDDDENGIIDIKREDAGQVDDDDENNQFKISQVLGHSTEITLKRSQVKVGMNFEFRTTIGIKT